MIDRSHATRLARATASLLGLAVGDALGGFFEFAGSHTRRRIADGLRQLLAETNQLIGIFVMLAAPQGSADAHIAT